MRTINKAVWHCSANREGTLADKDLTYLDRLHKDKGYRECGYHIVLPTDGRIQFGRDLNEIGAHVYGHNEDTIGICYIGGLDKDGKAKDTRNFYQLMTCSQVKNWLDYIFPGIEHVGHRDLSPDIDGDGEVEEWEWLKQCPCFDVKTEL